MNTSWLIGLTLGGAVLSASRRTEDRNLMRLPSFRGIAEVRASLPGRMRLYIPSISAYPEVAADMKRQLEATKVVSRLTINPKLSTVLICYDESQVEAAVIQGAVLKLMVLSEVLQKTPASRIETSLHTLAGAVNRGLLDATNGLLDLRTLLGSTLTFAGLKSLMSSGPAMPGAMTLLWWACNLWRRNDSGTL